MIPRADRIPSHPEEQLYLNDVGANIILILRAKAIQRHLPRVKVPNGLKFLARVSDGSHPDAKRLDFWLSAPSVVPK